jgi:endonuclease/exonuclease/phosphatase family metal-dependent hydrolase
VTIRLATYNILHGMPVLGGMPTPSRDADGHPLDLAALEDDAALRSAVATLGADVIGLQEVDVHQPRSAFTHQVRSVAGALDAEHWYFAPTVVGTPAEHGWSEADERLDHASTGPALRPRSGLPRNADTEVARMGPLYGVGLVSRLPVVEWRSTRFEPAPFKLPLMVPVEGGRPRFVRVPDEPRAAVAAVIEGPHGRFTVATLHLSFVPGYNARQLRAVQRWLADLPRPLVLLGDFNLPGRIPARITKFHELVHQPTYPAFGPRVQLDHMLADGFSAHELATAAAQVHLLPVSDHAAVPVDVDL